MFGMVRFACRVTALWLAQFAPCQASSLTVVSGPCETYSLIYTESVGGDGNGNYGYGYSYYGYGYGGNYSYGTYGYGGYGGNYSYGTYGYGPFFYGPYGSYTYGYSGDGSAECGGGLCCVYRPTSESDPRAYRGE